MATIKRVTREYKLFQRAAGTQDLPFVKDLEIVGDNMHRWRFKMCSFDDDLPGGRQLNADLASLLSRHGQGHLLMEVEFPTDYPHKPFFLRVVSPRCKLYTGHVTAGGSICLEALTTSGTSGSWQPSYTLENLLHTIVLNMIDCPSVHIQTPTGPGGLSGPLRVDFNCRNPLAEYSLSEAQSAFHRTSQNHLKTGWGLAPAPAITSPAPAPAVPAKPPAAAAPPLTSTTAAPALVAPAPSAAPAAAGAAAAPGARAATNRAAAAAAADAATSIAPASSSRVHKLKRAAKAAVRLLGLLRPRPAASPACAHTTAAAAGGGGSGGSAAAAAGAAAAAAGTTSGASSHNQQSRGLLQVRRGKSWRSTRQQPQQGAGLPAAPHQQGGAPTAAPQWQGGVASPAAPQWQGALPQAPPQWQGVTPPAALYWPGALPQAAPQWQGVWPQAAPQWQGAGPPAAPQSQVAALPAAAQPQGMVLPAAVQPQVVAPSAAAAAAQAQGAAPPAAHAQVVAPPAAAQPLAASPPAAAHAQGVAPPAAAQAQAAAPPAAAAAQPQGPALPAAAQAQAAAPPAAAAQVQGAAPPAAAQPLAASPPAAAQAQGAGPPAAAHAQGVAPPAAAQAQAAAPPAAQAQGAAPPAAAQAQGAAPPAAAQAQGAAPPAAAQAQGAAPPAAALPHRAAPTAVTQQQVVPPAAPQGQGVASPAAGWTGALWHRLLRNGTPQLLPSSPASSASPSPSSSSSAAAAAAAAVAAASAGLLGGAAPPASVQQQSAAAQQQQQQRAAPPAAAQDQEVAPPAPLSNVVQVQVQYPDYWDLNRLPGLSEPPAVITLPHQAASSRAAGSSTRNPRNPTGCPLEAAAAAKGVPDSMVAELMVQGVEQVDALAALLMGAEAGGGRWDPVAAGMEVFQCAGRGGPAWVWLERHRQEAQQQEQLQEKQQQEAADVMRRLLAQQRLPPKVVAVQRVQNPHLWQSYFFRRSQLAALAGAAGANEKLLFHGASAESVEAIVTEGFDIRLASMTGLFGAGTYFTDCVKTAVGYCTKKGNPPAPAAANTAASASRLAPLPRGGKRLILARVAVGRRKPGASGMRRPPAGADSVSGKLTGADVYVVFDNHQAYPEYVITLAP